MSLFTDLGREWHPNRDAQQPAEAQLENVQASEEQEVKLEAKRNSIKQILNDIADLWHPI